jgi:DNA replication and repair protein RecF
VFAPDDLILVKGGPGERRRYLDELVVALHPRNDALRAEVERVLRQRGALLKQAGGRLSAEVETTLDVWDMKLAEAGEALAAARAAALDALAPALAAAYDDLAARPSAVRATYEAPWRGDGLAAALVASRNDDVRRGVTTVGPHRDDLGISIEDRPSRTHASQGRTAHACSRHAVGGAPGGGGPHRHATRAAARRRVQRAGSHTVGGAAASPATRGRRC